MSFNSRESVIEWCHNVLENIKLTENEKKSIFYRFCTAYDFIMEKLFLIHQTIKEEQELKIFIITIFLLTYKLEGFSIAKITITNLINAFLTEFNINKEYLVDKIIFYEMKILELIDFNPQIFDDNNIYQLSYLLYDLFNKKYFTELTEQKKEKIEKMMNYINKSISFSEDMIFDIFPIDKAMISFYIPIKFYCKDDKIIMELLDKYCDYLTTNLKIIKLTKKDLYKYDNKLHKQIEVNLGEHGLFFLVIIIFGVFFSLINKYILYKINIVIVIMSIISIIIDIKILIISILFIFYKYYYCYKFEYLSLLFY